MFGPKIVAYTDRRETHHHEHVERVDPTVQPAAKFLREVETEAHKGVVSAMLASVESIGIDFVVYELERSLVDGTLRHRCAFKINGKQFDIGLSTAEREKPEEITMKVVEHIAIEIMRCAMASTPVLGEHLGYRGRTI